MPRSKTVLKYLPRLPPPFWWHTPQAIAAQATINLLAVSFIAFRIAYIFSYLKDKPSLRSAMWTGGFVCTIGLFVAAV